MGVEIESRYVVPDQILFAKLLKIESIGEYLLTPQGIHQITDHYLDTKGRALLHQGWACRLRSLDGIWSVTLKGPKTLEGAAVSRAEWEVPLARRTADVSRWPEGELRDRVRELTSGLPLRPLLTLRQIRHTFLVSDGARQVAVLSLDDVSTSRKGMRQRHHMLECELLEEGNALDLETLHEQFVKSCFLVPETHSKLQRALEWAESGGLVNERSASSVEPMAVEAVCERYDVDLGQAAHVANLADALYERLLPVHQLPESRRPLLHVAALLHNVGGTTDHAGRHVAGRDIILRQPIVGLDEEGRRIVAAAVYLHRKKATSGRIERAFPDVLPSEVRREALVMAALLRLAVALDASGTQSTSIDAVGPADKALRITVSGPYATEDAIQARSRSDLWAELFDTTLEWSVLEPTHPADLLGHIGAPQKDRIGLLPRDTMRDVARKILGFHFARMQQCGPGVREREDPDEVHDMRVAVRRLRSAIALFRAYLDPRYLWPALTGLRDLAHALGEVRDMDVAMARAERHLAMQTHLGRQREAARERLRAHLASPAYESHLAVFREMLHDLDQAQLGFVENYLATQVAPRLVYIRWRAVDAYGSILTNAPVELLHALRIDCKHLRYALEFFREVLPAKATMVIPEVVALQDHLGALHDAAVSLQLLDDAIMRRGGSAAPDGLAGYREACYLELTHLLRTFPRAWERYQEARPQRELGDTLLKCR
jgi:CHAD domain-containing protein